MGAEARVKLLFDLREIPRYDRHATILSLFATLEPGECLELASDDEPIMLWLQFESRFSGRSVWDFFKQGPQAYSIRITRKSTQ